MCAPIPACWVRCSAHRASRREEAEIAARAHELLEYVGIAKFADYKSRTLSYGDQRRLEIARALATDPKLIALDEPAAGMNATEKVQLRELIDQIRKDNRTILLIEHDVKLVMGLCDRVTVLDYGKQLSSGTPAEVQRDPKVIEAYLGTRRSLDVAPPRRAARVTPPGGDAGRLAKPDRRRSGKDTSLGDVLNEQGNMRWQTHYSKSPA